MIAGVFMETGLIQGRKPETESLINQVVSAASDSMKRGSVSAKILNTLEDALSDASLTAVMTIATCDQTFNAAEAVANQGKLHIAITSTSNMLCK